jgi:hypothetical protein
MKDVISNSDISHAYDTHSTKFDFQSKRSKDKISTEDVIASYRLEDKAKNFKSEERILPTIESTNYEIN